MGPFASSIQPTFQSQLTLQNGVVEVEPGRCMREMHWHPNTEEWQYFMEGTARMGVFASEVRSRTFDYRSGDVGYVPFAMGRYIENTGDTSLRFLETFKSPRFQDVSLSGVDGFDTSRTCTGPPIYESTSQS